jgi:hypothetical protein
MTLLRRLFVKCRLVGVRPAAVLCAALIVMPASCGDDGSREVQSASPEADASTTSSPTLGAVVSSAAATVPVQPPESILVDGTDANGDPISVQVDDLADWRSRAQSMSDEMLSHEPDGVFYTFVTDENGNPKPSQRCVRGAASDELKQQLREQGMPEESVEQLAACTVVP